MKFLPARPLLAVLSAWFALAVAAAWHPDLRTLWLQSGALLLFAMLFDLVRVWWAVTPRAQRRVNSTLAIGVPARVELNLAWSGAAASVEVVDHTPASFAVETALPMRARLAADKVVQLAYRARPLARGEQGFGPIALRLASPWRLWWRQEALPATQTVRVFPNFAPLARHALQATDARVAQVGVLKRRRRGEGMDFDQLREYRQGDSPRRIDWKASRRFDRLISREYQDERDQRILLLADCGRRMGARDGALSHFDHALDALLLLAYVGLRHGDSVGLMTLGGPQRRVAPRKSQAALSHILNAVYDLQPTLEATDFEAAAQELLAHERKRALVVILSNLRDEDDTGLLAACRLLGRRHLVLVASLREHALDQACQEEGGDTSTLALRAAALEYRSRRETTFRRLRQEGVLCLDVAPRELAVAAVNRYLAIKAEGRL
ncbi:DUF58 domain-containing protein [Niveibacterium sp. SC-1]|uniref:DUF58 domain-containing protein n=1 Tax=Niveibacterium sp. SC-1 TaxID=3135646 RepID=UPI00311D77F8